MAANDLLELILKNPDGQPDEVPWSHISPVVAGMETALGDAIRALLMRRHMLAMPQQEVGKPRALIAAMPRQGSLIIPFAFEMMEIAPILARPLLAGMEQRDAVSQVLSNLSDVASLVLFARDLMFGERGILARIQRQNIAGPAAVGHDRSIETVAPMFLEQLTASTIALMEAAERTGTESVHVRINDQSAIALTRTAPRRSPLLLADRGDMHVPIPGPPGSPETLAHYQIRRLTDGVRVSYQGQNRIAFASDAPDKANLVGAQSPARRVILWRADVPLPPLNDRYAVQARPVDRVDLTVEDDIPEDWPKAQFGVALVEKFRPDPDWT